MNNESIVYESNNIPSSHPSNSLQLPFPSLHSLARNVRNPKLSPTRVPTLPTLPTLPIDPQTPSSILYHTIIPMTDLPTGGVFSCHCYDFVNCYHRRLTYLTLCLCSFTLHSPFFNLDFSPLQCAFLRGYALLVNLLNF